MVSFNVLSFSLKIWGSLWPFVLFHSTIEYGGISKNIGTTSLNWPINETNKSIYWTIFFTHKVESTYLRSIYLQTSVSYHMSPTKYKVLSGHVVVHVLDLTSFSSATDKNRRNEHLVYIQTAQKFYSFSINLSVSSNKHLYYHLLILVY